MLTAVVNTLVVSWLVLQSWCRCVWRTWRRLHDGRGRPSYGEAPGDDDGRGGAAEADGAARVMQVRTINGERFVLVYDVDRAEEAAQALVRWAEDDELPFTHNHALAWFNELVVA